MRAARLTALAFLPLTAALAGCISVTANDWSDAPLRADMGDFGEATLVGASGARVGRAVLTQGPTGLLIRVEADGLTPGWHGVHIHATGRCDAPFTSAGAHVNHSDPKAPHGLLNAGGPDDGDLPNIFADASGQVRAELFTSRARIGIARGISVGEASHWFLLTVDEEFGAPLGVVRSVRSFTDDDALRSHLIQLQLDPDSATLAQGLRARDHLRAHGVAIVYEGRRRAGCQVSVEFLDPDGHHLELDWGVDQIGSDDRARPAEEWRQTATLEDAVRIAHEFPWIRFGSIEVRPVRDFDAVRRRVGA